MLYLYNNVGVLYASIIYQYIYRYRYKYILLIINMLKINTSEYILNWIDATVLKI